MVLTVGFEHLQTIRAHAESTYPDECCGLLLGQLNSGDGYKTVVEVWPTENVWSPQAAEELSDDISLTKKRRYVINHQEMLRAQREGRDRQLSIIGIYHSHTDHPAIPSEYDQKYAWPEYAYIIVSVTQGKAGEIYCWCLDDYHQFQSEELKIEN